MEINFTSVAILIVCLAVYKLVSVWISLQLVKMFEEYIVLKVIEKLNDEKE